MHLRGIIHSSELLNDLINSTFDLNLFSYIRVDGYALLSTDKGVSQHSIHQLSLN